MNQPLALVTGASRGIGAAIAENLSSQGFRVIGTATSEEGVSGIRERLASKGGGARLLRLQDTDSLEAWVHEFIEQEGVPFALVNNAGITRDTLMIRMKSEQWDEVIRVNLTAVFHLSQAFAKAMMKKREGRIVNISSVVASSSNLGQVNYISAKAGLEGMTRAMANELAPRSITVNAVAPGFIETDMTSSLKDSVKESILVHIPMNRMGAAKEVAAAVGFLSSKEASYVTGAVIPVNGGLYYH